MSSQSTHANSNDGLVEGTLTSDWVTVDQDMISLFARATLDPDPMHVDEAYAAKGPYGATIAFGFLTLSLLTHLLHSARNTSPVHDASEGHYLNYGFNRVRMVTPVLVNSRVRGVFRLINQETDAAGRLRAVYDCRVEIEGREKPALVAEWLGMWVPEAAA